MRKFLITLGIVILCVGALWGIKWIGEYPTRERDRKAAEYGRDVSNAINGRSSQ